MTADRGSMALVLVAPLLKEAGELGGATDRIVAALGVDADQLGNPDARVSRAAVFGAWEVAMKAIGDPSLPVRVGRQATIDSLGVLGYALYTSRTVEDSLVALTRYHDLVNDTGRWTIESAGGLCTITWQREGERTLGHRVANEQVLASFMTLSDQMTSSPLDIVEVRFRHDAPPELAAHREHFRGELRWGSHDDAVVFRAEPLGDSPRGHDPVTWRFFAKTVEEAMEKMGATGTWRRRTAAVVDRQLPSGIPTVSRVATVLDTSERTLRRRLKDEGTSFDSIVEQLQRTKAEALLGANVPLRDIAFSVGFSDASAFSRAYRRWTGTPPSARRAT